MPNTIGVKERILRRVEMLTECGCWIFMGATNDFGYGIAGLGGRGAGVDRVHRIMYRECVGDIPEGMFVCHKCDTPSCCNPDHLFLGTPKDNVIDCISKKRNSPPPKNPHLCGENHYKSKINPEIVRSMRSMRDSGMSYGKIAKIMNKNSSYVRAVCVGEKWGSVK